MNFIPSYCPDCGAKLKVATCKPTNSWSKNFVCSECAQKYVVILGDTQGGAEYCNMNAVDVFPEEQIKI